MSAKPIVEELGAERVDDDTLLLYPKVDGRWPEEVTITPDELETWFGAGRYDVPERLREEARRIAHPSPDRPKIVITNKHLDDLRDQAIDALLAHNSPPVLYAQGGYVAEVYATEDHTHVIRRPDRTRMRERLSEVARWYRKATNGKKQPTKPDVDVAATLLATPALRLPPLVAVTEIPVLRPDGRFTLRHGYDPLAHVYFAPSSDLGWFRDEGPVDADDVRNSLGLIDKMIGKFPFKERADKLNALAFLLTPVLRPVIAGPTPMAAISAPMPGTGKTLLVESIVRMLIGKAPPVLRLGTDENEVEKRITAHLKRGPQFSFLDNVPTGQTFDSAAVAAVLTSTLWSGRVIMSSDMPDLPNVATWVATGNNLSLGPELARRSYLIELDANMEHPETRTFEIDLPSWVPANRRDLLNATMTLVRAWTQAGMPLTDAPVLGSFEPWSRTLGGVLQTLAEQTGADFPFLANEQRKRVETQTDVLDDTAMMLELIHEVMGDEPWTTRELINASGPGSNDMLDGLPVNRYAEGAARKLGYALRSTVKGSYGPFKLVATDEKNASRGGRLYRVLRRPER
ncbi:MAG: hypothetical protein WD556_09540 [Actinomycetota bacterium]